MIIQQILKNGDQVDISDYYLMLMEGDITNIEFEKLVFERTGQILK